MCAVLHCTIHAYLPLDVLIFIVSFFVCCGQLLDKPVGLVDLASIDADLKMGLEQLLQYEGTDVEHVFDRTFTVEQEGVLVLLNAALSRSECIRDVVDSSINCQIQQTLPSFSFLLLFLELTFHHFILFNSA